MTSTGTGTHGNNLHSPNENELYVLINRGTGDIDKIGITGVDGGGPSGRYTEQQLEDWNVRYQPMQQFPDRLSARTAEVAANLMYFASHGRLPRLTFRW